MNAQERHVYVVGFVHGLSIGILVASIVVALVNSAWANGVCIGAVVNGACVGTVMPIPGDSPPNQFDQQGRGAHTSDELGMDLDGGRLHNYTQPRLFPDGQLKWVDPNESER